jgi:hypothetical protein
MKRSKENKGKAKEEQKKNVWEKNKGKSSCKSKYEIT